MGMLSLYQQDSFFLGIGGALVGMFLASSSSSPYISVKQGRHARPAAPVLVPHGNAPHRIKVRSHLELIVREVGNLGKIRAWLFPLTVLGKCRAYVEAHLAGNKSGG